MDTPYRQLSWMYLCFENSRLLLSPFRLSADWRFGAVPLIESYLNPRNMLAMITLVAFGMLAWFGLNGNGKRHKVVLLGVALIVFPYLPASNLFFPVGFVVAERVLYLPSMGSSLLVAYGLCHLFQATKSSFYLPRSIACFIILLMVLYTGKTLQRNRDWYSNMALYSAGVKFNPNNGLMLSSLASEYAHLKNYSYAEELYRTAIAVAPHYSRGYANLGGLMEALKRYDEAEWVCCYTKLHG